MRTDRIYRTEGIVMRRRDQGEADRVLTLCTPLGKIDIIAKGARKVRSRKAGHIELFSHSSFVIARVKNSWDIVSQAETIRSHQLLRGDLLRGAYARYATELLDSFFAQGEGSLALVDLLDNALTWFCGDGDPELIARFYEQHLLALAGYRPELFRCVADHGDPVPLLPRHPGTDEEPLFGFDPERGGAQCQDCFSNGRARRGILQLSREGLWLLQELQRLPYSRLGNRKISAALHQEVERVMQPYITFHLERGIKSRAFLKQLKRGATSPSDHDGTRTAPPRSRSTLY